MGKKINADRVCDLCEQFIIGFEIGAIIMLVVMFSVLIATLI